MMKTKPTKTAPEYLEKLVAFPTVSAVSNLDLLRFVESEVSQYGAKTRLFPNETGDKANLLVTIGPDAPGGIVFSGHTDVVPTEGQAWTGDPWTLRRRDDRVIGRGATDMKGFLACCLAALQDIPVGQLSHPIHLAFSYDEEVGCTGVGSMAEWLGQSDLKPRYAVIGEATGMDLISAHKAGLIGWTTVTGKPGHSSQPDRYVNAVMVAADLISYINRIRAEMRDGPRFEGLDPPYSTIQVNQIAGGLHGNIVAEQCRFFWEMRIIPGESDIAVLERIRAYARDELEPAMKAISAETGISIDMQARIPGLKQNDDRTIEAELLGMLGRERARAVPYGTEAGIFQNAGIPSVVIGPGDVADAHQPDESIACDELDRCVAFLTRVGATCC
jgi:acetylornithine deacetylase